MQPGLTVHGAMALFGVMLVLAFVPSMSVLAVTARTASSGFIQGLFTTAGIVTGDIVYVLIAVLGLSFLTDVMSGWFALIKYAGGAYLIWLSLHLWRSAPQAGDITTGDEHSKWSAFMTGLLITLADYKVVLFYLGFFPAFMDLSAITYPGLGAIVAITIVAVGGPKLCYAWIANRARGLIKPRAHKYINRLAGITLAAVGVVLIAGIG